VVGWRFGGLAGSVERVRAGGSSGWSHLTGALALLILLEQLALVLYLRSVLCKVCVDAKKVGCSEREPTGSARRKPICNHAASARSQPTHPLLNDVLLFLSQGPLAQLLEQIVSPVLKGGDAGDECTCASFRAVPLRSIVTAATPTVCAALDALRQETYPPAPARAYPHDPRDLHPSRQPAALAFGGPSSLLW